MQISDSQNCHFYFSQFYKNKACKSLDRPLELLLWEIFIFNAASKLHFLTGEFREPSLTLIMFTLQSSRNNVLIFLELTVAWLPLLNLTKLNMLLCNPLLDVRTEILSRPARISSRKRWHFQMGRIELKNLIIWVRPTFNVP